MRAIVIERYGSPDCLRERELPLPSPGPGEVRIRVSASGVNFADLLQRLKLYSETPQLPYVPGFEVSGTVDELGPNCGRFQPGDRVVALSRFGGYAQAVCVSENHVRILPEEVPFVDGAAIPVNFLTAWFCLYNMGNIRSGESVLIQGGAGGVGTAAIQLALGTGCEVFATAGSQDKVEFLRGIGAQHPINYRSEDFSQVVREATSGRGVDVVLDGVGGETLKKGYELVAPLGRIISFGLSSAAPGMKRRPLSALLALWRTPAFRPLSLMGRNVGVFGFHLGYLESRRAEVAAAFDQILALTASGRLRPVIDRVFPLTAGGAVAAHERIHQRSNIGKVILSTEASSG